MSLRKRIQSPTPRWFKNIIRVSLSLAAVGTALLTACNTVNGFVLPPVAEKIAQYFVVAGIVGAAISKTARE